MKESRFHLASFIPHLSAKRILSILFSLGFFFTPCFAQGTYARGDVNGDGVVDIADALLIQQVVDGKREQDSVVFRAGYSNGDVNYDGAVNGTDARIIMEYCTGLRSSLPTDPDGDRTFVYYQGDHLGSANIITDRYGEIVQHVEYTPFGTVRHDTNLGVSVNHLYTGQELDKETGLYYYNARYYDSKIGRFISPDTLVPDATNSQQFNRYSYVLNNPIMNTDPSGHMTDEEEEQWEAERQQRAAARQKQEEKEREEREQKYAQEWAALGDSIQDIIDSYADINTALKYLHDEGLFGDIPLESIQKAYEDLKEALDKLEREYSELEIIKMIGGLVASASDSDNFNSLMEQAIVQVNFIAKISSSKEEWLLVIRGNTRSDSFGDIVSSRLLHQPYVPGHVWSELRGPNGWAMNRGNYPPELRGYHDDSKRESDFEYTFYLAGDKASAVAQEMLVIDDFSHFRHNCVNSVEEVLDAAGINHPSFGIFNDPKAVEKWVNGLGYENEFR